MSTFLHPALLWGLGLAAVPILIHLLNRRRYRTVRWAAMDFLRAAFRRNRRRLRFENLLLLLVRTALIVLLVFALARPFLKGRVAGALASRENHYTIIIDNSYSMAWNEGLETPFARAVHEASGILSSLEAEDSATLYLTNDNFFGARPGTPRAVVRDSHDAEKLRAILGRLRPSDARSGVAGVLARVADELDERRPGKEVVLLTDLQRAAWESGTGGEEGGGLTGEERTIRDCLGEIVRKGAAFHLVDVGGTGAGNVAVLDLAPAEDRTLVEGNTEDFIARIANYGRRPAAIDVRFTVDGKQRGAVPVTVPPAHAVGRAGQAVARITLPPLRAGHRVVAAEIPADGLTVDDRRLFAVDVRESINVLAVDGDPAPEPPRSPETRYLKVAIGLMSDRIELSGMDSLAFLGTSLDRCDMVILANVERVRESKVSALERFVERGGALAVFLGDKVDASLLNRDFGKDGHGLLPGVLDPKPVLLDPGSSRVRLALEGPPHPLLTGMIGTAPDSEGFWKDLWPKVWGWYRVKPYEGDPSVRVILRYTDPDHSPAILEKRYGRGRVLLVTTSADKDWNDIPGAAYMAVPLFHMLVYYLTREDPARMNLAPFATYARELPERVEEIQVTTPDGGRVRVPPVLEAKKAPRIEFRDTGEAGLYRVSTKVRGAGAIDAGTSRSRAIFAVNVDGREGDIRRLGRTEITGRYAGIDLHYARTWTGTVAERARKPEGEIWRGLAAAVLLLLFLELFLARRFGDYAHSRREGEAAA